MLLFEIPATGTGLSASCASGQVRPHRTDDMGKG